MSQTAEELLELFSRLSGMQVTLFDSNFYGLCSFPKHCGETRFCSLLHQSHACLERCIRSDMEAKKQCLRVNDLYSYLCPFGLFEAILPLRNGQMIMGYIMIGQSLPAGQKAEERSRQSLTPYLAQLGDQAAAAQQQLSRHTEEEYEVLCQTLRVFADRIAEGGLFMGDTGNVAHLTLRYLQGNYSQRITLAELSRVFHCSTVTLTEGFRKEYGETIMNALNRIRLTRAEELLRCTTLSVGEIAARCGFSDVGYFSKRFRAVYRLSPVGYRQANSRSPDVPVIQ